MTVRQGTKFFILFHFNLNGHNGYLLDSAGFNQYKCSKILAIIIIVVVVIVTLLLGQGEGRNKIKIYSATWAHCFWSRYVIIVIGQIWKERFGT